MNIKVDPRAVISAPTNKQDEPAAVKKHKDLESLRESTREFEALYVMEMYKAMRKTIPENGLFPQNTSSKMFQEMMDMELARDTAKGDGMGIGLAMYNQMKGAIENKKY